MTSSYNINSSSVAISVIAFLLLFAASTPLLVHGQMPEIPPLPFPILSTVMGLLSNMTGPLLPEFELNRVQVPITRNPLPPTLSVVGRVTCPGQGTGVGGVPVNLTCISKTFDVISGQSVTNADGSFTVNATASPRRVIGLLGSLLQNSTLPCLVSTPQQLVQSAVSCPTLTNATSMVVSLVQFTAGRDTFSQDDAVLSANATTSIAV